MTTQTTPRTYSEANRQARLVTLQELAEIIATDNNPYVWWAERKHRRIAMNLHIFNSPLGHGSWPMWEQCNRKGYTETAAGLDGTIFHFHSVGTVKLAEGER